MSSIIRIDASGPEDLRKILHVLCVWQKGSLFGIFLQYCPLGKNLADLAAQVVPSAVYFLEAGFFVHGAFHTFFGGRAGNRAVVRHELDRARRIEGTARRAQDIQPVPAQCFICIQLGGARVRVPACQQVGSIVQGEGGEPRAHQSQRCGRVQGSGCGKLAQVPPAAGTVYLAACAGAAGLRIIQGCFAHAPHSKRA